MAAPNAAPPETPTNPGSANGLRNKPCIAPPDNASTPPTANPNKVRGRRICPRISSACSSPSGAKGRPIMRNAARKVSSNGRLTGPSANDSQIASKHSRLRPMNNARGFTRTVIEQQCRDRNRH
ncbi:hypothetical protein D3C84_1080210 [compost metagenome]